MFLLYTGRVQETPKGTKIVLKFIKQHHNKSQPLALFAVPNESPEFGQIQLLKHFVSAPIIQVCIGWVYKGAGENTSEHWFSSHAILCFCFYARWHKFIIRFKHIYKLYMGLYCFWAVQKCGFAGFFFFKEPTKIPAKLVTAAAGISLAEIDQSQALFLNPFFLKL